MFPFRVLKPMTLFITGTLIAVGLGTYNVLNFTGTYDDIRLSRQAAIITAAQQAGKHVSADQKQLQQRWQAKIAEKAVTKAKIDSAVAEAHVWTVNLIVSAIWLRVFEFGPVEWVWRSLSYWKLQPMRVRA